MILITCVLALDPIFRPNDLNKKTTEFCLLGDDDNGYTNCVHCRSGKSNYGENDDDTTKSD